MARRGIRPLVNSYKNVVDTSGALGAASVSTTTLAAAVEMGANAQEGASVPIGAKISAVFYSLYVFTDAIESTSPLVDVYWAKWPSSAVTEPVPGAVGASDVKRFVFHEEKGLAGNRTSGTPMVIKGVLKVPKPYARFGRGEQFEMRIRSAVAGFFCAKHIYKVFY